MVLTFLIKLKPISSMNHLLQASNFKAERKTSWYYFLFLSFLFFGDFCVPPRSASSQFLLCEILSNRSMKEFLRLQTSCFKHLKAVLFTLKYINTFRGGKQKHFFWISCIRLDSTFFFKIIFSDSIPNSSSFVSFANFYFSSNGYFYVGTYSFGNPLLKV